MQSIGRNHPHDLVDILYVVEPSSGQRGNEIMYDCSGSRPKRCQNKPVSRNNRSYAVKILVGGRECDHQSRSRNDLDAMILEVCFPTFKVIIEVGDGRKSVVV